ncbi:MAG: group I truncated hemoglobin [Terriglobales bacterium]
MTTKAAPALQPVGSMFARLGGREAITATVGQFYERVLADGELKPFFARTNMTWLKLRQTQFFVQALGGPAEYKGKTMKLAHSGLEIEPRHFQGVARHLSETLASLQVPKPLIAEVMTAVASLEPDIVTHQ